jgi:hypothetical protein
MADTIMMFFSSCRSLLADFLSVASASIKSHWFPVLSDVGDSLAVLLGLDYKQRYLPLMIGCGLIKIKKVKGKTCLSVPISGNTWESFISEFKLTDIEVTKSFIRQHGFSRVLIRVGRSSGQ